MWATGKAAKQGPRQGQAALHVGSPQLIVSSDQKAMAVWWPLRLSPWSSPLPEACVAYKWATTSLPGGGFCHLCFLPSGASYTSGWKGVGGRDLGDLGTGTRPAQVPQVNLLILSYRILKAELEGVFNSVPMGLTTISLSVKVCTKIFFSWEAVSCFSPPTGR